MAFFIFLRGSILFEGIAIVSTCLKVLKDFKSNILKVDIFIVTRVYCFQHTSYWFLLV